MGTYVLIFIWGAVLSIEVKECVRIVAPEEEHLFRNLVILPVVLSAFESDRIYFERDHSVAMTPYVRVVQRAIARIMEDIEQLTHLLRLRGIEVFVEKRNRDGIHRVFTCRGNRSVYRLFWGSFDGEITLLTDYYLRHVTEGGSLGKKA
jgi:hypothetical protein